MVILVIGLTLVAAHLEPFML